MTLTLEEARASGASRYFTGLPCKHGHIAERKVCDRACTECDRLRSAERKESVKRATPGWADKEAIARVYKSCGPRSCVDHIVPLQGDLVCGLHVHYNLRCIGRKLNTSKKNKWHPVRNSRFLSPYGLEIYR